MNTHQAELYHHGIKGQRWGVRRYQNADGSLTNAGLHRYYGPNAKHQIGNTRLVDSSAKAKQRKFDNSSSGNPSKDDRQHHGLTDRQKTILKVGAAVAATGLATYGAYKLHEISVKNDVMKRVSSEIDDLSKVNLDTLALKTRNRDLTSFDALRTKSRETKQIKKDTAARIYKEEAAFRRKNALAKVGDKLTGSQRAKSDFSSPLNKWSRNMSISQLAAENEKRAAAKEFSDKYGQRAVYELLNRHR